MVYPILEYGAVSGDQPWVETRTQGRVQRLVTKMVPSRQPTPTIRRQIEETLFTQHTLQKSERRHDQCTKFWLEKIRMYSTRPFAPAPTDQGTRGHSLKLSKPAVNKVIRYILSVQVINNWNKLSEEVVTTPSINNSIYIIPSVQWSSPPHSLLFFA